MLNYSLWRRVLCAAFVWASSAIAFVSPEGAITDILLENLNKTGMYVDREMSPAQLKRLKKALEKMGWGKLDDATVKQIGHMITQEARHKGPRAVRLEKGVTFLNMSQSKGLVGESLAYQELVEEYGKDFEVRYTKSKAQSSDIIIRRNGKVFKGVQVKVGSMDYCFTHGAKDGVDFYANKTPKMQYEARIPKDAYEEMVRKGKISESGKMKDTRAMAEKIWKENQEALAKAGGNPKPGSNASRRKLYESVDEIEAALKKVRFKKMKYTNKQVEAIHRVCVQHAKILQGFAARIKPLTDAGKKIADKAIKKVPLLRKLKAPIVVAGKVLVVVGVVAEIGVPIYELYDANVAYDAGLITRHEFERRRGSALFPPVVGGAVAVAGVIATVAVTGSMVAPVFVLSIGYLAGSIGGSFLADKGGQIWASSWIVKQNEARRQRIVSLLAGLYSRESSFSITPAVMSALCDDKFFCDAYAQAYNQRGINAPRF